MSIKKRLAKLEAKPAAIQMVHPANGVQTAESKTSQRAFVKRLQSKLGLPLPAGSTSDERSEMLRLLRAAIAAAKFDANDQSGFETLQTCNATLHRKYGSRPPTDSN